MEKITAELANIVYTGCLECRQPFTVGDIIVSDLNDNMYHLGCLTQYEVANPGEGVRQADLTSLEEGVRWN